MNILIKSERGEIIDFLEEKLDVNTIQSFISFLLSELDTDIEFLKKLPLISHTDLYTDTYVNQTQAPLYIEEFEKLSKHTQDENLKRYCQIIITELNNLEFGDFLVFSGD